jgi:hypothetical protein
MTKSVTEATGEILSSVVGVYKYYPQLESNGTVTCNTWCLLGALIISTEASASYSELCGRGLVGITRVWALNCETVLMDDALASVLMCLLGALIISTEASASSIKTVSQLRAHTRVIPTKPSHDSSFSEIVLLSGWTARVMTKSVTEATGEILSSTKPLPQSSESPLSPLSPTWS